LKLMIMERLKLNKNLGGDQKSLPFFDFFLLKLIIYIDKLNKIVYNIR
jgi:hypothetical protein